MAAGRHGADPPSGHGGAWEACAAEHERIRGWLHARGETVHDLLARRGVEVPYRTLHRYAAERLDLGRVPSTVRIADGQPGEELQVDFGRMGLLLDPETGRRRMVWALVCTAVVSRHTFVWLAFRQTIEEVIDGFEAAWAFYGGVFKVVIVDNLKAIVDRADATHARINVTFGEYAQARGFVVDPAKVRRPQDRPRVERTVAYVRGSLWAGDDFADLADAQRRAEVWCRIRAGMRIHGMRRDHHLQVAKAPYSVPGDLIGQQVTVRVDSALVKILFRGQVVKIHPRQEPGGRSTDATDLPSERTAYALRDLDRLQRDAARHAHAIGAFAAGGSGSPRPPGTRSPRRPPGRAHALTGCRW